jgi:hypothetical protein
MEIVKSCIPSFSSHSSIAQSRFRKIYAHGSKASASVAARVMIDKMQKPNIVKKTEEQGY